MRPVAVLLALAGMTFVVADCAADTAKPLSRGEYEKRMQPLARQLTGALGTLQKLAATSVVYPAKPTAARDAVAATEKTQATLRVVAGRLETIVPPAAVESDHARLTRGTRKLIAELSPAIKKMRQGYLIAAANLPRLQGAREIQAALTALAKKGYRISAG